MSNSNSSNKIMVPNAREAMNKFKMEAANEVGVNLKQGYNIFLTIWPPTEPACLLVRSPL